MNAFCMLGLGNVFLTVSPKEEWERRETPSWLLTLFPIEAGLSGKCYYWQSRNIISCHLASQGSCNRASAGEERRLHGGVGVDKCT